MLFAVCSLSGFDLASHVQSLTEKAVTIPAAGDLGEAAVRRERHVVAVHAPSGASAYW